MQFDIRILLTQQREFVLRFLNAIFAKDALPRDQGSTDFFNRSRLADGDERGVPAARADCAEMIRD